MARTVSLCFSEGRAFDLDGKPVDLSRLLNVGEADSFTMELFGGQIVSGRFQSDSGVFAAETTLDLALTYPRVMRSGAVVIGYGGDETEEIPLAGIDSYELEIALNSLPSIHSAGGVEVSGISGGLFRVRFQSVGTRTAISLTHSECGDMSDRVAESNPGTASVREAQTLDFRVQKIAIASTWSAISAATVAASVVTSGTSTVHQHERITLSRPVNGGWFLVSCDGGTTWSQPISLDSGAYDLQAALECHSPGTYQTARTRSGLETRWDVFRARAGAVSNALQVRSTGLNSMNGKTGAVDFSAFRRAVALIGQSEPMNARLILRTGATLSSGSLTAGITLLDQPFTFHPPAVSAPIDLSLFPA